jgi:hypothetical protein
MKADAELLREAFEVARRVGSPTPLRELGDRCGKSLEILSLLKQALVLARDNNRVDWLLANFVDWTATLRQCEAEILQLSTLQADIKRTVGDRV